MKTYDTAQELVSALNERFCENTGCIYEPPFSYTTDGESEVIKFIDTTIWCSNYTGYAAEDEGESLSDIVRALFVEYLDCVNAVSPETLFVD